MSSTLAKLRHGMKQDASGHLILIPPSCSPYTHSSSAHPPQAWRLYSSRTWSRSSCVIFLVDDDDDEDIGNTMRMHDSFLLGMRSVTATPRSEGGGGSFKLTAGPYVGRFAGGGKRVRLLAHTLHLSHLLTRKFDRTRYMVTCAMALAIPVPCFLSAGRRFRSASTPSTCQVQT